MLRRRRSSSQSPVSSTLPSLMATLARCRIHRSIMSNRGRAHRQQTPSMYAARASNSMSLQCRHPSTAVMSSASPHRHTQCHKTPSPSRMSKATQSTLLQSSTECHRDTTAMPVQCQPSSKNPQHTSAASHSTASQMMDSSSRR